MEYNYYLRQTYRSDGSVWVCIHEAATAEKLGYLAADETELRELTDSAIAKLRRMNDAEYDALDLFPDFEKEDMDAE